MCSDWNMITDTFYLIFLPFAWLTLKSVLIHHPLYFQISLLKMTWLKQPSFLCLKKKSKHLSWILWQKKWSSWFELSEQSESRLIIKESMSPQAPKLDSTQSSTSLECRIQWSTKPSQVESSQNRWLGKKNRLVETIFAL